MRKVWIYIACAAIIAIAAYCYYDNLDTFTGDRVKDPDRYTITFTDMNQQDTHTMVLNRGDSLAVDYAIDKGHMDLIVSHDGETRIYTGRDIRFGIFELPIRQDGTYLIEVNARHAAGYLMIRRAGEDDGKRSP